MTERRMVGAVLPFLLSTTLAGCGDAGPALSETPLLAAAEEVRYGEEAGRPGMLVEPADVAPLPGGGILVSEPGRGWLLEFDEDGAFVGFVVGGGDGPPIHVPGRLGWHGDTLAVTDFRRGIGLLDAEGGWLGMLSFPPSTDPFPLRPAVLLADGSVGAVAAVPDGLVAEGAVTRELWVRATPAGEVLDTLVHLDARGRAVVLEVRGLRGVLSHPTPFDPLWVPARDGSSFFLVERLPVVREGGAALRVHRIGVDGDTLARAAFPYDPVPLDEARRDSVARAVAAERAEGSGFSPDEMAAAVREQLRWPPHLPPVTAAVATGEGGLWLRRQGPADPARWDLLDAELRPVGHVLLPAGLEVRAVRGDRVWGVLVEEGGRPRVVRYRVGAQDRGAERAESLPPTPEEAFRALETRLLAADSVAVVFQVTAEGAAEIRLEGRLRKGPDALELTASGTFGPQPVELALRTGTDGLSWGRASDPATGPVPPALWEAVALGLTRMGILHNLARLTGNALPDHADAGADAWVVVDGFEGGAGAPSFAITVAGQPTGTATLELGADGLPRVRTQTVQFPNGEMRVVERYREVVIRP